MLALGVLLLCLTGAFTGLAIADNRSGGPTYSVVMLNNHLATLNTLQIFLSGVVLALIFGLAVLMVIWGGARGRRRARGLRAARREAARATKERDKLAARVPGEAAADTATTTRTRRLHLFGH